MSGLQLGTMTSKPPSTLATTQPISPKVSAISAGVYSTPVNSEAKDAGKKTVTAFGELSTKQPKASAFAPANSSSSAIARAAANSATVGSTPRSNRFDASLGSL